MHRAHVPSIDPELPDLLRPWINDRSIAAATYIIEQFLEKDAYLRSIIIVQRSQLCADEDEMATYDDELTAANKQIDDLKAQIAKLKPAPAPSK